MNLAGICISTVVHATLFSATESSVMRKKVICCSISKRYVRADRHSDCFLGQGYVCERSGLDERFIRTNARCVRAAYSDEPS